MPSTATPQRRAARSGTSRKRKTAGTRRRAKTPRTHKPEGMSLEEWQIALRREFGREQKFKLRSLDDDAVFGDFLVENPQTRGRYRVSVRGANPGDNFCTCPDFSVNTLGTCKHIEFALARIERRPGGRAALRRGYRPAYSEVYLRYGVDREVALRRGTDCPADVDARIAPFLDANDQLHRDRFDQFDAFLDALRLGDHEVRLRDDALAHVAQWRDNQARQRRIDELFPDGERSAAFEGLLSVALYPYQRQGALFAARAGRALLADDMGLGKTVQSLAAVEILARAARIERVLIVAPTSLKHQWLQEIRRFTRRDAEVIEGPTAARRAAIARDGFFKIVNYETLRHDLDAIGSWAPDLVILDEAQRIKNWKTRTAQTVKRLPAPHAIVLTGTPLENRLQELHSIVEFVDRFRLGPSFRFLAEHQTLDEGGRVVGYRNLDQISRTLEPVLLRRTKAQVLKELPERLEKQLFVPLSDEQRAYHEENREIVARIVTKWRRHRFLSESDQRRMTCALQNMRMACDSTYLLDPSSESGRKPDEVIQQLEEVLERGGAKVVVFSQWLRTHELLAARLEKRRLPYVLFHGGVPGPKRKDLVERFRQDANCRVFLSTDAGGVGLNLQNASAVFNVDLPWNPAVLEQRIGRVHRLGQQRAVHVVSFVSENSIEHSMLDTLRFKSSLFAGVLDGGKSEVFLGGTRLAKFMESVEAVSSQPAASAPVAPPERATPAAGATKADAGRAPDAAPSAAGSQGRILQQLVETGRQLLDGLAAALREPADSSRGMMNAAAAVRIERDSSGGEDVLKIPLPSEQTLGRALVWLQTLSGLLAPAASR
jgi:superfamily II DNA or RNA helicase